VWERPKSASWPLWVLEAEEGEDKGYNYCANQSQEEEPIFHHATNNGCLQSWSSAAAGEKESELSTTCVQKHLKEEDMQPQTYSRKGNFMLIMVNYLNS